ncbi:MAG: TM2 domain-containing protein [Saprospiraceae bacterium]|nr:TM2 domain-containing protein [Saprospiraceae bacterium]
MYPEIQTGGDEKEPGHKKKGVATLLALFFGMFGVHRFYLGQWILGVIYLMITISTILIASAGGPPFVSFMGISD